METKAQHQRCLYSAAYALIDREACYEVDLGDGSEHYRLDQARGWPIVGSGKQFPVHTVVW